MGLLNIFKKKSNKKELESQVATSGSKLHTQLIGFIEEADETSETALEILSMKVAKKIGNYQHKDKKIEELVQKNLEQMEGSLQFTVKDLIEEGFMAGFAGAEIVWKIEQGEVRTKKIITLSSSECAYDYETDNFTFDNISIPKEKRILYIRKKGKSDKLNKLVRTKEILFQMWCQYIESFITPILHGKGDDVESLSNNLRDLFFKKSISTDTEVEINAIKLDSGGSAEIQSAMEYIDKLVFRMFFLGSNFSNGEKAGTTANSQANENVLEDITDWLAEEIRELLVESYIRKLIEYNKGEQEDYGQFVYKGKKDTDMLHKLAMTLEILSRIGYISIEDINNIRERFDLPEIAESDIEKIDIDEKVNELMKNVKNT